VVAPERGLSIRPEMSLPWGSPVQRFNGELLIAGGSPGSTTNRDAGSGMGAISEIATRRSVAEATGSVHAGAGVMAYADLWLINNAQPNYRYPARFSHTSRAATIEAFIPPCRSCSSIPLPGADSLVEASGTWGRHAIGFDKSERARLNSSALRDSVVSMRRTSDQI